jgi:uncharacterized DUF497 family protein
MTAMDLLHFAEHSMSTHGKPAGPPADFPAPVEFEWDPANWLQNERHSVSDAEAEQVFFNEPLLLLEGPPHATPAKRWQALGRTNDHRLLKIAFRLREERRRLRIVSARPMHPRERKIYAQATQADS